jgi:hypothetical protein
MAVPILMLLFNLMVLEAKTSKELSRIGIILVQCLLRRLFAQE